MGILHRVRAIEARMNLHDDTPLCVFWDGTHEDPWREHVEEARQHGAPLIVICLGAMHAAKTVEEAEALVAQHRAQDEVCSITVYREGAVPEEVLAEWDPGLPEWLRDDMDP